MMESDDYELAEPFALKVILSIACLIAAVRGLWR